jgi:hypothetical protein
MKRIIVMMFSIMLFFGSAFAGDWEDEYSYDGFKENLNKQSYHFCINLCAETRNSYLSSCRYNHQFGTDDYYTCEDRVLSRYERCTYSCRSEYRMN